MNIYFDTEFTGLHKNTTLISIGMIAENGRTFYAELNDYDKNQVNDWIKDNVIANLVHGGKSFNHTFDDCTSCSCVMSESKEHVKTELEKWLSQFDSVQLVSDVCHYDMVLFIDLFGSAFDLPQNVNASCHDINQDIAKYYNVSEKDAFNISREEIFLSLNQNNAAGIKHNALYDAAVIKAIYNGINTCYQCYENK